MAGKSRKVSDDTQATINKDDILKKEHLRKQYYDDIETFHQVVAIVDGGLQVTKNFVHVYGYRRVNGLPVKYGVWVDHKNIHEIYDNVYDAVDRFFALKRLFVKS